MKQIERLKRNSKHHRKTKRTTVNEGIVYWGGWIDGFPGLSGDKQRGNGIQKRMLPTRLENEFDFRGPVRPGDDGR